MDNESLNQVKFRKWHVCVEKILSYPDYSDRLDTGDYKYSQDFDSLVTAIAKPSIKKDEIEAALTRLKKRKMNLQSDGFKTDVGNFITLTSSVYNNADEARSYLKEKGWLPRPDSGKREPPKPVQPNTPKPAPTQPKPAPNQDYPRTENTNNSYNSYDIIDDLYTRYESGHNRQYENYKTSVFDKINDAFENVRYRLDIVLEYVEQYSETIFYFLLGILGAAGIFYTFYTGHWIWGIIEIIAAINIGIYALVIGGVLVKWLLKLTVRILQCIFFRWWVPLLIMAIIGGGFTYKYAKDGRLPEIIEQINKKEHKENTTTDASKSKAATKQEASKPDKKPAGTAKQGGQQNKQKKQTTKTQQSTASKQSSARQGGTSGNTSSTKRTTESAKPAKQAEQTAAPKPQKSRYEQNIDAANGGDAAACYTIAQCYLNGEGTGKDKVKAFQYMKAAAEGGYTKAYVEVAKMYHGGRGVTKDRDEAERWYRKAAANGNAEAKKILQNM